MPHDKFSIILADPPWQYRDKLTNGKRGAVHKYPVMSIEAICALPVANLAAEDCALFIWRVPAMEAECDRVIEAWGFRKVTRAFNWVKMARTPSVEICGERHYKRPHFGMGRWTRGNPEDCILAVKGKPKRVDASVESLVIAPRGRHSEKPAEVRRRIVQLLGDLPRVELFARERVDGWDAIGHDVGVPF